jgi:hypothetical protein
LLTAFNIVIINKEKCTLSDVMYFTRHVVAWHATCALPIGSYRLLGGNMLTRGISTRGIFWSDGPRLPSFDRTAHQYAKFEKKATNWAGICWHVACWHVADVDRTVHVYRAGTCHVEIINCEKVRLPRQICNFCVFAVVPSPVFLFLESAFFFICLSRPQDCSDCDCWAANGITGRAPTTPGEVSTGVGRTATYDKCQLLIGWHRFEAYSACHVAKIDTWYHLIGPRGNTCHVSSTHWSIQFLMPVGVDTWQPCGRLWSDGPR